MNKTINLSPAQYSIITEASATMPLLKNARDILARKFPFEASQELVDLIERWKMERSMSFSFGNYVLLQANHYASDIHPYDSRPIFPIHTRLDPKGVSALLLKNLSQEIDSIKEAITALTENPFNTQVFSLELPRGKMHTIVQFNDETPKEAVTGFYFSTALVREVAQFVLADYARKMRS